MNAAEACMALVREVQRVLYIHDEALKEFDLAVIGRAINACRAQGIETGTAETEGLGPKDESPVA
jgi:hypothetical protein